MLCRGRRRAIWLRRCGKHNLNDKPAIRRVARRNRSVMQPYSAVGDCQSKPCPATLPGTVSSDAMERLEDILQLVLRNANAVVSNPNQRDSWRFTIPAFQRNID